jgi:hypothetical protein
MAAFDVIQKTIRHESWDTDEEVVIRELTYGEQVKINNSMMGNVTIGEAQDETKREQILMGTLNLDKQHIDKMKMCIVSWTFKQNGKPLPVTVDTLRALKASYGDYIQEQIEELNPTRDEEFPGDSKAGN